MFKYLILLAFLCGTSIGSECGNDVGWTHWEGKCYYSASIEKDGDFFYNKEKCARIDKDATMVTIGTDAENRFIRTNVTTEINKCYWIGLQEIAYGLQRYAWMDHSQFSVAYWERAPTIRGNACNAFAVQNGLWQEKDCAATCAIMCQKYLSKDRPKSLSNKAIDRIGETQMTIMESQTKINETLHNKVKENDRKIQDLDDLTSGLSIACLILLILVVILIIAVIVICVQVGRLGRRATFNNNK